MTFFPDGGCILQNKVIENCDIFTCLKSILCTAYYKKAGFSKVFLH